MEIKLYNTLSRSKEVFVPIKEGKVGVYSCGPTVYNYAHIGNLRTYVFMDILRRIFEYNNYKVKSVMNITDVGHLLSDADDGDDKMAKAMAVIAFIAEDGRAVGVGLNKKSSATCLP